MPNTGLIYSYPIERGRHMLNIAVLGYGTVGSGVVEVMFKNEESITKRAKNDLRVKCILTRRSYPGDKYENLMVQDFSIIENDPDITIVAECIGGVGAALDYVRRALLAGKSVVTSNKELVAEYGYELLCIAREKNLNFLFEASVGGGIPIIRPLNQCLAANELTEICGILNGTTNFILTKMIRSGLDFDLALKQAQENGYAESDPAADIEGHDACRKICILAALSFGRHVYPNQVPTEGITKITLEDVAYAAAAGKRIKLLGRVFMGDDGKLIIYVAPHLLDESNQLANVEDVFNAIVVKGDAIGDVMFFGRGAGKLPTASAVVADVIDASKHITARKYIEWSEGGPDAVSDALAEPIRWYVRARTTEEKARAVFGNIEVIARSGASEGVTAFITEPISKYGVDAAVLPLDAMSVIRVLE